MNTSPIPLLVACACLAAPLPASHPQSQSITGDYLEVRTCDVYTGPCFANSEMGLSGKECMLVWSIRQGAWEGTDLSGLHVIAIIRANDTLGDLRYQDRHGQAMLVVDSLATPLQHRALANFARTMAGPLARKLVDVKTAPIQTQIGSCSQSGCARVQAKDLVQIDTRCLSDQDHVCGNEEVFYPPLLPTQNARPVYTELAAYSGPGLNTTWQSTNQRSAFIGTFSH